MVRGGGVAATDGGRASKRWAAALPCGAEDEEGERGGRRGRRAVAKAGESGGGWGRKRPLSADSEDVREAGGVEESEAGGPGSGEAMGSIEDPEQKGQGAGRKPSKKASGKGSGQGSSMAKEEAPVHRGLEIEIAEVKWDTLTTGQARSRRRQWPMPGEHTIMPRPWLHQRMPSTRTGCTACEALHVQPRHLRAVYTDPPCCACISPNPCITEQVGVEGTCEPSSGSSLSVGETPSTIPCEVSPPCPGSASSTAAPPAESTPPSLLASKRPDQLDVSSPTPTSTEGGSPASFSNSHGSTAHDSALLARTFLQPPGSPTLELSMTATTPSKVPQPAPPALLLPVFLPKGLGRPFCPPQRGCVCSVPNIRAVCISVSRTIPAV